MSVTPPPPMPPPEVPRFLVKQRNGSHEVLHTLLLIVGIASVVTGTAWYLWRVAEARAAAEAKLQEANQHQLIQKVITANDKFGVCRVYTLDFVRTLGCPNGFCNQSEISESRPLKLLAKINQVRGIEAPIHLLSDSPDVPTWWWTPAENIKRVLGSDLAEEQRRSFSLGGERFGVEYLERLRLTGSYRWTLNLGCRDFGQVDAITPLTDGMKVEFSWHWNPTRLGEADGLRSSRQRGTAYLTGAKDQLKIDQINFASDPD